MRISSSVLVAVGLALSATAWILSGQMNDSPANTPDAMPKADAPAAKAPFAVRVRRSVAEPYVGSIRITGQTMASRHLDLKAQIDGRVVRLGAAKGDVMQRGALLVQLDPEDRPARLEQAKARVAQREIEFRAADQLAERGFQAATKRAEAWADLQESKAQKERIETEIAHTTIVAPFAAVLETRQVEIGHVLKAGDPVARLIDLDPILVTAQVAENDYLKLSRDQRATGRLLDGTQLDGVIRYIATAADQATRTFKVELEIANPDLRIVEGVTAELAVPLPPVATHRISASLFTLGPKGRLGVKAVGGDGKVAFLPIEIAGGTADEAFVLGLPETVDLITVGQEFVTTGDAVRAVPEAAAGTPAAAGARS